MTMKERRLMHVVILAVLALGICGTQAVAAVGPQFGLRPAMPDPAVPNSSSYFVLDTQPGQTLQRSVRVTNRGDTAGTAHLYPVDANTGTNSGIVYHDEKDPRSDVGAWITLDSDMLMLNPGESKDVAFTITVSMSPRPGQHLGGIAVEDGSMVSNSSGTAQSGASVNFKIRTVMGVQLNLPGQTIEKIAVTDVTTDGQLGKQQLVVGLRNEGNTLVAPTGTIVVTNDKGEELQHLALKLDKMLPETAIEYPVPVEKTALDAGQYQANVTLTYGQSGETHYQMPLIITKEQVAKIFPSGQQTAAQAMPAAAPTLVAPASRSGTSGSAPVAMPFLPDAPWLLIAGVVVGGLLVLGLVCGAFALGRRNSRS